MIPPLGYLLFAGHPQERFVLTLLVVLVCALPVGGRIVQAARNALNWLGRRPIRAMALVFLVAFAAVSSLAIRRGMPLPYVHDEFSYLLAADTYAGGRLTNPAPPSPEHFESMHILVRPTYMSKYPPGQGLMLALGQALFGHPVWGAWLTNALAAAAAVWMLRAFVPGTWAVLGALMLAIHPQMLEWGQRYWGGSVGVVGGLLVLGAAGRIMSRGPMRWTTGVVLGAGLLVLANSRPFEGFVLSVLLAAATIIALIRRPPPRRFARLIVPALIVLLPGAVWMGYANWRTTGHPLRMSYMEHQRQYGIVPLFIFQNANPKPVYHSREMDVFHDREQGYWYQRRNSWPKLREEAQKNLLRLYEGSLGNVEVLAVPLLILPWVVWKDRRMRLLLGALLFFLAALLTETFMFPHYASPAAGVVLVVMVILLRWMWRIDPRIGRLLARVTLSVFALWCLFWWIGFFNWKQDPESWQARRHRVETELLGEREGKHLVFVRYGDHNVHEEWVYNRADLPGAKVIWARELPDGASNQRVVDAFPGRAVWRVEPENWCGPVPYPAP